MNNSLSQLENINEYEIGHFFDPLYPEIQPMQDPLLQVVTL